jgi:hypothetical protein
VQNGEYLQRSRIGPIDNHAIEEFRQRPVAHRERGSVLPPGSHQGMFRKPATGGKDFHFHTVGGVPVVFGDKPPDGIQVFRRLRRELKGAFIPAASAPRIENLAGILVRPGPDGQVDHALLFRFQVD